jgi:hypothetical protein
MRMTSSEMQLALNLIAKGGKLFVGSDYAGRRKIKIKHGPFQIFANRFSVTEQDLDLIKSKLSTNGNRLSVN